MTLAALGSKVRAGGVLDAAEVAAACEALLDGEVSIEDRAGFLTTLRARGETAGELALFAAELLARAVPFPAPGSGVIDVCGTGGDRSGTFNISTAVSFVVAGAGVKVAKHGNRGITSKCGGADVLAALGVNIAPTPAQAARALEEAGCCFLFAPAYHPAVKAVAPVRAEMARQGRSSLFNLLGPLINPACPDFQLVGVYEARSLDLYAEALAAIGRQRAWAVHGAGERGSGLDEISISGPTEVAETTSNGLRRFEIDPRSLGLPTAPPAELEGGDAQAGAGIIRAILDGAERGPKRTIVVLNAAAALVVAGRASGLPEGLEAATASIEDGRAMRALEGLREKTA